MIYAKLLLVISVGDEREFDVEKEVVTLGRDLDNDIVLPSPTVSRHHARMVLAPTATIEDLGSSFGTYIGDERITKRELNSGDVISLAGMRLRFELPPQAEVSPRTVVDLSVASAPAIEDAAHKATLTQTLIDVGPEVAAEARRQDATLQVVIASTDARLVVREEGVSHDVPLESAPMIIGRGADSQVVLHTRRASRRHAEIQPQDHGYAIADLGSANGTLVNGEPITAAHTLHDGDMIVIGEALIVYRAPAEPESPQPPEAPEFALPHGARPLGRRPVVFVPGMMGSGLRRGQQILWPNYPYMLSHPFAMLPNSGPVEVMGVVHETVVVPHLVKHDSYARLTRFLQESMGYELDIDLLEFPYDWRLDNRLSAQQLAAKIRSWRESLGHGPVTILAHSMGGLVARYYLDQLGGRDHVDRFVVMGTPHSGTTKAASVMIGGTGMGPFAIVGELARTVSLGNQSSYQILPLFPCVFAGRDEPIDIFRDTTWLAEEHRPMLADAADFYKSLEPRATVSTLCVVGYGMPTMSRINVTRSELGWKVQNFVLEPIGDGGVAEQSAILDGADIHPVHQNHGALFSDPDVQRRLRYELTERRGS